MALSPSCAVRKPQLLSVDVSELLRRPGASRQLRMDLALDGLSLPMAHLSEGSPVRLDLRLEALVDGIHARGPVTASIVFACRRCLRELSQQLEVGLDELFLYPGQLGEEAYSVVDQHIDLELPIRDAIILELPLNPLCREDCRGLCPTCGADRNEVECGHTSQHIDLRWDALEQLRRSMED
jgi:DUF177 domain-containing protein